MTTIIRALLVMLALSVSTQVVSARQQVVEVKFPKVVDSALLVIWQPHVLRNKEMQRNLKFRGELSLHEFQDQSRGWDVILYTGDMCTVVRDRRGRHMGTIVNLRYIFFKGNREYFTDVNMSKTIRESIKPRVFSHCTVDNTERHINVYSRY